MIVRVYEIQLDRYQLLFQKNLENKRFVHFLVSVKWFIFSSIKYLLVKNYSFYGTFSFCLIELQLMVS